VRGTGELAVVPTAALASRFVFIWMLVVATAGILLAWLTLIGPRAELVEICPSTAG